mmetsp:Transcript_8191/g.8192  ORF Transcript_8191/g.8192 Transcript_8191/m.8192 type:complete len:246 (-) Transcript_8191:106-843(-)
MLGFSQLVQYSKGNIYHHKNSFVTTIKCHSTRYSNDFNPIADYSLGGLICQKRSKPLLQCIQNDADTSFGDLKYQERFKLKLNAIQKDVDKWKKPELPPFKINDLSALLFECGFIFLSQLFLGIYTVMNSGEDFHFTQFLESKSLETFYSATVFHTFFASIGLSLFWVFSKWWSRNLEKNIFFYRLKDAFDATWQQWIAVANLYIASSLVYSFINHVEVTGIESPLLSGAVAILIARILYYGIPV